jgi:hypothetical protein
MNNYDDTYDKFTQTKEECEMQVWSSAVNPTICVRHLGVLDLDRLHAERGFGWAGLRTIFTIDHRCM